MKKFSITIGSATREVNANEYSVAPKTNAFKATVVGAESTAWTTSGKGKSAVNNHYVYFREGTTLYYFKSDAAEVIAARAGLTVALPGAPTNPAGGALHLATSDIGLIDTAPVVATPKGRRTRAKA